MSLDIKADMEKETSVVENVADTGKLEDSDKIYSYNIVDTFKYEKTRVQLIEQRDSLQLIIDQLNVIIGEIDKL